MYMNGYGTHQDNMDITHQDNMDIKNIQLNSSAEAERYFDLKGGELSTVEAARIISDKVMRENRARHAGAKHKALPKLRALADRVREWINHQPLNGWTKELHAAQVHLIAIELSIENMLNDPLYPVSNQSMLTWNRLYKLYEDFVYHI